MLLGRRRARQRLRRAARHDFPICVPIGSQAPHAAGVALAFKLRSEPRVAVVPVRRRRHLEGRLLRGHELRRRVAGCPCCSWSSTTGGRSRCRGRADRRRDAGAEGHRRRLHGLQVDGNDLIAVREAAARAAGTGARRRRAEPDRGADLPPGRPHHRRRRAPLPRRGRGRRRAGSGSRSRACAATWSPRRLGQARGGSRLLAECAAAGRRGGQRLPGAAGAAGRRAMFEHLFATLPAALAARARRAARGSRGRGASRDGRSSRSSRPSRRRSRARWRRPARRWCWARTSASTAACSAPPTGCSRGSGRSACSTRRWTEALLAGLAVGLGGAGHEAGGRGAVHGFIYPMVDQLVSHAARLRNRTRGRLTCPMVLRAPWGGGIRAPEHHSESPRRSSPTSRACAW